jgi:hypothetical protein
MYSFQTLDITGYQNEPLPNTFLKQEGQADSAALVLPGVGYTAHMPVLYYPSKELLARGADVLWVEYNRRHGFSDMPQSDVTRCAMIDALAAYQALLQQRHYRQLTVIGKSLGTFAMGQLLATTQLSLPVRAVWLTPLLRIAGLRAWIEQAKLPSLFVIGTADPHYDVSLLADLQTKVAGASVVIEGADHSLEIPGDVTRSLQAMERIMQGLQAFL